MNPEGLSVREIGELLRRTGRGGLPTWDARLLGSRLVELSEDRGPVLSAVKLAESAELLTAVKIVNLLREKGHHRAADQVADHFLPRGGTP